MMSAWCTWAVVALLASSVTSAPLAQEGTGSGDAKEIKTDAPVEQLEKLKSAEATKEETVGKAHEHIEFHSLETTPKIKMRSMMERVYPEDTGTPKYRRNTKDCLAPDSSSNAVAWSRPLRDAVQQNGELVSRVEQHATADAAPGDTPVLHAQTQLDLPAHDVHKVVVQDGSKVTVLDVTTAAPTNDEQTPKVFHGAARLIQAGSGSNNAAPQNGHTAARRSFNADITKETNNNMDHFSSYGGVSYSPLDMAEYVFWTGDERGVTSAIEDFLQQGLMSKEEAIAFLQEIKFNIDYLRAHYAQNAKAADENAQQEKLRNLLLEQANAKEYQYRNPGLQSFAFGNSPDIIRSIASKNWELSNNLSPYSYLPVSADLRPEPVKRTFDPMLQTNIISTSDYDRDGPIISEEEYEEMMEKLKAADSLYTEYTLEEIIYQLAKMMFSQSLSREPAGARAATQRFMTFLEMQAERGHLSRSIEKKVLDVMIAALTDTIGEHPELQARDGAGAAGMPAHRIMRQFLEGRAAEPGMPRAILAAYKDELLKAPAYKYAFADTK